MLWWALYDYFYLGLVRGDPVSAPPGIPIGGTLLLPRPTIRLAPWGEEVGLSGLLGFAGGLAEAELLFGPLADGAPAFTFTGYAAFFDLADRLDLGGRLGLWFQPEIPEGLLEAEAALRIFDWGRLYAVLGAKTRGYLAGRQYEAGLYGQLGILLTL